MANEPRPLAFPTDAPRSDARWRFALAKAAIALWLPALLPFAVGPLRECGHCVRTHLCFVPVLPGVLLGTLAPRHDWAFLAVAALASALLLAVATLAMQALDRRWPWLAIALAMVSGLQAIGFAYLLRM